MRLCFLAALTFTLFLTLQNKHPLIFLHQKVSAFSGENVSQRQEGGKLRSWYSGPTLVQVCSYSRRDVCVSLWASLVQEYHTIADKIPTFFCSAWRKYPFPNMDELVLFKVSTHYSRIQTTTLHNLDQLLTEMWFKCAESPLRMMCTDVSPGNRGNLVVSGQVVQGEV